MKKSIMVELDETLIDRIHKMAKQKDIAFDSALEELLETRCAERRSRKRQRQASFAGETVGEAN